MAIFLGLKSRKRLSVIMVMAVLIPATLAMMPEEWHQRMYTIEDFQTDGSAMGRINAWKFAWNLVKDNPVLGGGCKTFTPALFQKYSNSPENVHDAHSIYFEMLAEQGFVGLGLFLSIGIFAIFASQSLIRFSKGNPDLIWAHDLGSMCQIAFIGYAIGGAFLGLAYWDLPYTLVAVVAIARGIAEKEVENQQNQLTAT
jgi:probable O-glycosylation ligase (exosortase A-associated)